MKIPATFLLIFFVVIGSTELIEDEFQYELEVESSVEENEEDQLTEEERLKKELNIFIDDNSPAISAVSSKNLTFINSPANSVSNSFSLTFRDSPRNYAFMCENVTVINSYRVILMNVNNRIIRDQSFSTFTGNFYVLPNVAPKVKKSMK